MSSIIILLATSAHAMDCNNRVLQACEAANLAADQVNLLNPIPGEVLVDDSHPTWKRRTHFLYNRFRRMVEDAEVECGGPVVIEGTVAGVFSRTYLGSGVIEGAWADIGGDDAAMHGAIQGKNYVGVYEGDPDGHLGELDAVHTGAWIRQDVDEGFWGGGRVWMGSGNGYFAAVYGSCAPPDVAADRYDFVGNVPLVAGHAPSYATGAVHAPKGLLDNDAESSVIVGVSDGFAMCAADSAPFDCSTELGGFVTVNEDGTFDYLPPAGGGADSFEVIVQRPTGGATATSRVDLEPTGRVWYLEEGQHGFGTLVEPAGSLDALGDQVESGDVIYLSGGIDAGQGATLRGEVQVVSGEVPLVLDVDLNDVLGPVDLSFYQGRASVFVDGYAAFAIDTELASAVVHVEGIDFVGDDGGAGRLAVSGAGGHALTLQGVNMDGAGIGITVAPAGGGEPGSLVIAQSQFAGPMAVAGLQYDGQVEGEVTLSEVLFAEVGHGLHLETSEAANLTVSLTDLEGSALGDVVSVASVGNSNVAFGMSQVEISGATRAVQLSASEDSTVTLAVSDVSLFGVEFAFSLDVDDGAALLGELENVQADYCYDGIDLNVTNGYANLYVENSEFLVEGTFLAVDAQEDASVELAVAGVMGDAGEQAVKIDNATYGGPGVQAHFVQNVLASHSSYLVPAVAIASAYNGTTDVALHDNVIYHQGLAMTVEGDHTSQTGLTLLGNEVEGGDLRFSTTHSQSEMCLDLQAVDVQRDAFLRQEAGSEFRLAGYSGSPTNPYQIESFLRSQNNGWYEVEQFGGASVYYQGTSGCPQQWMP